MSRLDINQAAVQLDMSTKTLRRKIKEGSIYASLEDGKYFIPQTEIDRVLDMSKLLDKHIVDSPMDKSKRMSKPISTPTEVISLSKEEYHRLIYRLGQLEEREQRLLEYQASQEEKALELEQARKRIAELEEQLTTRRRGWWRRLFNKK